MKQTNKHPDVDLYLDALTSWREEVAALRAIVLSRDVEEVIKWKQPTYVVDGTNTIIISTRKDAAVIGFFKGVLLNDPAGILTTPGPNTQSAMYAAFTSVAQIKKHKANLLALITQAIQHERDGLRVEFKKIEEHAVPAELQQVLDTRPDVRAAFSTLTPGRQRGYLMHIGGAKQHTTRCARVEACIPTILAGKGLNGR